jgi:hypothetical protein
VGNISYSDHNTVSKAFPSLQTWIISVLGTS